MDERLREIPIVTILLTVIVLIFGFFVTGLFPTEESLEAVWWDEQAAEEGQWWRALTAIFSHGGILHLVVNTLALISFGPLVERKIGPLKFAGLWFGAGFSSLLAHAIYRPEMPVVGASGSIFGILGLLMILAPRMRMLLFFFWETRILTFGVLYAAFVPILLQFEAGSFIAHEAHLGGMIFGTIAAFLVNAKKAILVMPAALVVFFLLTFLIGAWARFLARIPCEFTFADLFGWLGCVLTEFWSDIAFFIGTLLAIAGTVGAYVYLEVKNL